MKIAIYHNLDKGGALVQLEKLIEKIKVDHDVHIFSPNEVLKNITKTTHHFYKTTQPSNLYSYLLHATIELPQINKNISIEILRNNFDVVYVFPCKVLQSPDIIRFLKNKNLLYFFAERKREFYEKTSYDYFSIKRTMARILRFPVQLKDFINCRNADKIITNSIFSNSILNRTYGKKSIVIYPGMKHVVPINKKVANTDKAIIVGQLSYTKGYDIAFNLLSNAGYREVTVIGRKTDDFNQIINISSNLGIKINLLETEDDDEKDKLYKKHGVFIACQRNEPFGITTLEACYNNNIVFGLNEGGTSEIIHHGLNGFLFDKESIINASKLLSMLRIRKSTNIIKINTIDWRIMAEKIISISK